MPASVERFRIFITLYTVELKSTIIVPATVFATNGPLPCFDRSNPIITNFLTGVLNIRVRITAISANTSVNKSWIIFAMYLTHKKLYFIFYAEDGLKGSLEHVWSCVTFGISF
jgi:hypothetical protein